MTTIAERFVVLRGAPGVRPFDAETLDAWAADALLAEAERDCVRFVLHLWNALVEWKSGRFDVAAAVKRWDADQREAFLGWFHGLSRQEEPPCASAADVGFVSLPSCKKLRPGEG